MRTEVLRELAEEISAADIDPRTKDAVRRLIYSVASRHGITCFEREEQIAFVQHLRFNLKERRSTIRDRLIVKFGVSRSTAYERIDEALQVSAVEAMTRTGSAFNNNGNTNKD